ncbi:hypothetical protein A2307_01270 [Candidatus Peregrinibacteria bacterium RIFOXYB2_FULL_33_20]|nr:MAG: hypothetical protein A2307_01270 [Candidatus Peregrinibacteria bacterium RIFOXYB2_FULL_33_20]
MNARNLLYIAKYNSVSNKKFADNKIFTKNFLQMRDLSVAKLYATIANHKSLNNFNFNDLPSSFVIKPNKGYGGSGILIIKDKKNDVFIESDGYKISKYDLYKHCVDIVDGKYAISGLSDTVIIEERLESDPFFKPLLETNSLPDIRIIVFNLIPVIAMLRLPTKESEGKANLHMGGIGIGIDIGTGQCTYGVRHNQFITKLPNQLKIEEVKIPKWENILLMAAKIQQVSNIGYLAVDLAMTKNGVKVLEVNARAGLSIQIANKAPLKVRLEKVKDLKVLNPAQGIEIAKTLFSQKLISNKHSKKEIIGIYEPILILGGKHIKATAKVSFENDSNEIDRNLVVGDEEVINVIIKGKRLKLQFKKADFSGKSYSVILSYQYLKDFLIDPSHINLNSNTFKDLNEKIIINIDKKIFEIDSKIKLLSHLKPLNLIEEKTKFFQNPTISPHFVYKTPNFDFDSLRKELNKIPREVDHVLLPIYLNKITEINKKISLIESINTLDFGAYSEQLYGIANRYIYKSALDYIENNQFHPDKSKFINFKDIIKSLDKYLNQKKLNKWDIVVSEESPADIQVNKDHTIFLNKNALFTENRLKAVIAHEIDTHIFRLENGRKQKYGIFERGTAGYLATEEGLAIYNQEKLSVPLGIKHIQHAITAIAIYFGKKMTFCELFHYLKDTYHISEELSWKICVKVKRGLINTTIKTSFTKNLVYFTGYQEIKKYFSVENENPEIKQNTIMDRMKKLYVGKITIQDLELLKNFPLEPASLIPSP